MLSGIKIVKINGKLVFIHPFKVEDRVEADFLASEEYEDLSLTGEFTSDDLESFMIERGFWSDEEQKSLDKLEEDIEQMKVDYYQNFFSSSRKEFIAGHLETNIKKRMDILSKKNKYFDKTCEYIRDYNKTLFLLEKSSFFKDGSLVKDNCNLFVLMSKYTTSILSEKEIRSIAKDQEWKTLWSAAKGDGQLFSNRYCDLTNEQLSLISWSKLYDGIQESMEKPEEAIIQDDTAFDGWLITQSRKRKAEEKRNAAEKLVPKNAQDGEIFIPVKNQKEMSDVYSLNDGNAKRIISSTKKDLERKGVVKEVDRSSTRQQLKIMANNMASESRRK